ncbi:hypothetical protein JA1_001396 [Spathaspora sp. JA1]|nr:hypothetical protein JA1_001396 [Spathaspora sp. JA1]
MVDRLLPAPPPTINAWTLNQLIENNTTSTTNSTSDEEIPQVLTSPPISQEYLPQFESTPHSAPPITKRKPNHNGASSIMVRIGKNTTIKKPTRSQSGNIKGGMGAYKYKIRNGYHHYINNPTQIYSDDNEEYQNGIDEESTASQSPIEGQILYSPPPIPFTIPIFPIYPVFDYYTSPVEVKPKSSSNHDIIKRQLEYYFSTENLCKDRYLRSLFDPNDGSVKLADLIQFNRLKILTKNGTNFPLLIENY